MKTTTFVPNDFQSHGLFNEDVLVSEMLSFSRLASVAGRIVDKRISVVANTEPSGSHFNVESS